MPAKEGSITQYRTTYQNLIKRAGSDDVDKICQYIVGCKFKDNTKLAYFNSLVCLHKIDPANVKGDLSKLIEMKNKMQAQINQTRDKDNITEGQKKAMDNVDMNMLKQLCSRMGELKSYGLKHLEDYLLINLMTKYPVRNDFQEILLTSKKVDLKNPGNWLFVPRTGVAVFSIKEYKTSKTHGENVITLSAEDTDDVRKLKKMDPNRKYLFESATGSPMTQTGFTHRLQSITKLAFNVPFSSTIIRKMYLTDKYKDTAEAMKKDAKLLGHNVSSSIESYISNNK